MDISQTFWEENSNMQPVKYESCNSNDEHPRMKDEPNLYRYCDGNLNFATVACSEDDSEYGSYHKKTKVSRQDPMSHRIIEKRRRDRMNNCLADLSRLIPADYLKKGRGRIEKTEIIEMAIKHMKYLQQTRVTERPPLNTEHYRLGFQECMSETMRFLVEVEGFFAHEALCVKLINHLQTHCEAVLTSDRLHTGNCTVPSNKNAGNCTRPIVSPVISPNGQTHTDPSYDTNSQLRDMLSSTSIKDSSSTNSVTNHHTVANHRDSNHINGMMINDTRVLSPVNNEKDQISSEELYSNMRNGRNKNLYEYQRQEPEDMSQHLSEVNSLYTTDSKIMNYDRIGQTSENEGSLYDKSRECTNGASLYKFKNNIMQRINQESISESISNHSLNKSLKRKKLTDNMDHRISLTENNFTYSENHSNSPTDGSQTSPHSSDVYTRISSESDNPSRISPTGSSVSDNKQMERQSPKRFSNFPKHQMSQHSHDLKNGNASHFERSSPNNMKNNAKNSINQHFQTKNSEKPNFGIPIFVLHAKGSFYIPLTIDYHTLMPYLQNYNILDITHSIHNIILHPVTINVNFQPNNLENVCPAVNKQIKYKTEVQNGWH